MAKRARSSRGKGQRTKRTESVAEQVSTAIVDTSVDFTNDYYYVYNDMRTMLVITILMVGVTVGLSYVI